MGFIDGNIATDRNIEAINNILFQKAQALHKQPRETVTFTTIPESDYLLNNIEDYPHIFVLGCVMDRGISAERAWNIPCIISKECGGPEFSRLLSLDLDAIKSIFKEKSLHRYINQMPGCFSSGIEIIHSKYHDNASNIWKYNNPDCKEVIRRFDEFKGVGQKISTMATNILVRDFKIPLQNTNEIDISVDIQVRKAFKRLGLITANASNQEIIETARKIYPDYPGIADSIVWEIGRLWCEDLSNCCKCFLNKFCPKNPL
ncbi:MAG TPA: hypothetical protein VMB35_01400 [Methanomicrobiales archaeon]|nr:hypothetical protein [Methanomicrobiales archaeon]